MACSVFIENRLYDYQAPIILTDETRLHNDFFYMKRDSHPTNKELDVKFGLASLSVFDYDAPTESIVINAYVRQIWFNPAIHWNPEDYGGIRKVNVWPDMTWIPDVYAYGDVEAQFKYNGQMSSLNTRIVVRYDGQHSWYAPIVMKLACRMKVRDFPFDTQICPLVFGSFSQDKSKINLVSESVGIRKYTGGTEWYIESMNHTIEDILRPGSTIKFSNIRYTLVLKRKSLFFILKLLGPAMALTFLTLLGFVQPLAGSERVVYNLSIILVFVWLIVSGFDGINDYIPKSSEGFPLSNIFLGVSYISMALICVLLCCTILVHYGNSGFTEMPIFVRKYFLEILGTHFRYNKERETPPWRRSLRLVNEREFDANSSTLASYLSSSFDSAASDEDIFRRFLARNAAESLETLCGDIDQLHMRLDVYLKRLEDEDDSRCREREWNTLALVLDHLFLYAFTTILAFTSFYCVTLTVNLGYGI